MYFDYVEFLRILTLQLGEKLIMNENRFASRLLETAVGEFAKLPGVGKRTALRHVLHLLKLKKETAIQLGQAVIELIENIRHCKICNNLSDKNTCEICEDHSRDNTTLCVV